MTLATKVEPTGHRNVDAVLWGDQWSTRALTFTFPQDLSNYPSPYPSEDEETVGFMPIEAIVANAVRHVLATQFSAVSNLRFQEVTPSLEVDLKFARTTQAETAQGHIPGFDNEAIAGDVWFNPDDYSNPGRGNYAYATVMHEIGHTLGLKHGHDGGQPSQGYGVSVLPISGERDAVEFSIMSYRTYPGGNIDGYTAEGSNYPQTLMMYDIAALQHMYGANFSTNSGNTTYTFSPTTGEMFVDGVGQGASGENRLLLTIWDGGGTDTYDFSNYTENLSVDLQPGTWSILSEAQLAVLDYSAPFHHAYGNIYNALQHRGDARSLIENANGGFGNDVIIGNAADNTIDGGGGSNWLDGGAGVDTALLNASLMEASLSVLNQARLIVRAGGEADALLNFERFVFSDGIVDLGAGSPLVDDLYYYMSNKDVWTAGEDAEAHYARLGWQEGRDPNGMFSTSGYLAAYADIQDSNINPLEHYRQYGWKEGRDPSSGFDTSLYLLRNPDVAAAGIDPLTHFLSSGWSEGREAHDAVGRVIRAGLDSEFYLLANPDVGAAAIDPSAHYQQHGWREGRDPNAYFDVGLYLERYADVAAADMDPLLHYDTFGWKEERVTSPEFNGAAYRAAYADVAEAQVNPLQHFLELGIFEARSPFG